MLDGHSLMNRSSRRRNKDKSKTELKNQIHNEFHWIEAWTEEKEERAKGPLQSFHKYRQLPTICQALL